MAVKRKKKKSKTKRVSFKLGSSKRKTKQRAGWYRRSLISVLIIAAVVCVLAAAGVGFVFLEKYVNKTAGVSEKTGCLALVNAPVWVSEALEEKIYSAAVSDGEDLKLDKDAACSVQNNLEREVAWLEEVTVQTTHERLLISAQWRKPLAMVKSGLRKFYLDAKLVVLDFVPMPNLPIVNVKGLSGVIRLPSPGGVCQRQDLAAAVAILDQLDRMDQLVTADKPLLYEIDAIDVSNFNGRENSREPHIVLYATDNTKISWGAELGAWQRHLEATDEEKLAKLYSYYKEHGSLLDSVKYIDLRNPQDKIPLPVDKY